MQNPLNIKNTIVFPNEDGNHDIRFVDASYRELFTIPDHSNIIVSYPDGTQCSMPCTYMDDTHVDINGNPYHICEFAERMMEVSATYAPEHPQPNPTYGTYEIYQIADTHRTNYCFMGYKYAKYQLNPKDYQREYAGMLPKGMTLEQIFRRHNADNRPFGTRMRSLSVSDVIVLKHGNKKEAFYVDATGFQKVNQFLQKKPRNKERGNER